MLGYFNRPDATGARDRRGRLAPHRRPRPRRRTRLLHIVDRLKEVIKYKGMQIAPAELEGVLISHPAVADAAVIPVPDEEAGEIPKAFVVLKGDATTEELLGFVAARVAPFKKIRRMEIIDEIPKSPSGKIQTCAAGARTRPA